jgi:hypothetical protein
MRHAHFVHGVHSVHPVRLALKVASPHAGWLRRDSTITKHQHGRVATAVQGKRQA